jgi:hypothetical protein
VTSVGCGKQGTGLSMGDALSCYGKAIQYLAESDKGTGQRSAKVL